MKKWFLKNKDKILIGIISGIVAPVTISIFKFLFGLFKFDENKILVFLSKVLKFSITLPVYLIILLIVLWAMIAGIYRKIKISRQKLKIISAKYYTDFRSVDITSELNNAIEDDKLKIILSNNIAGDPHENKRKKGKIKYKFNGEENEKEYQERDVIELP